MRRLLVVSHACITPVNQVVFDELAARGWDVTLVLPDRWNDAYARGAYDATHRGSRVALAPRRVVLAGQPQRHVYVARLAAIARSAAPAVAFVEQEPFSLSALQWSLALRRTGIPFGLAGAETLDRPLPLPARLARSSTLAHADFVAARSPTAADLVRSWGAAGQVRVIPHAVPSWPVAPHVDEGVFTVGFAGRLVPEKGIDDLLRAVRQLAPPVRVLAVGDGPLREALESASTTEHAVEVAPGTRHDAMAAQYARMDVLVLPSRTTRRWAEQFGRVLAEAMACGVPVVGSSSGEIPWTIGAAGRVVPEGDAAALARTLEELRRDDEVRRTLVARGHERARAFSVGAVADLLEEALAAAAHPALAVAA